MVIRAPKNDDFDALAEITNHYITTSAIHPSFRPLPASTLRAVYKLRDRHAWYVYEDDEGAVLGYARSGGWGDYREEAYGWTCEVAVYVAERAQRRGIGSKIYDAVLNECAKIYRSALARITLPNEKAIAFHERFGFERAGAIKDAFYKNKSWHDVEIWQKRFKTGPGGP